MKWHRGLSADKWLSHPMEARIEMVKNELSRARSAQLSGYYGSIKLALERALELLDLTVETSVQDPALGKLLRWCERIARAYLFPEEQIPEDLFDPA